MGEDYVRRGSKLSRGSKTELSPTSPDGGGGGGGGGDSGKGPQVEF